MALRPGRYDAIGAAHGEEEITGFRAACALRRMLHHDAARSSITEEHILAADLLRLQVDAVLIEFQARPARSLIPIPEERDARPAVGAASDGRPALGQGLEAVAAGV